MLPEENVSQYGHRVRNLVRGAKSCLVGSDREQHADALLEAIDPVGCFLDGLPSELEVRVSAKKPATIEDAIDEVRKEERRNQRRLETRE